jgi:membrane protein required for colicin V production
MDVLLTSLDYVILAVLAISMVVGIVRGLVRELLALLSWVVSVWLALHYAEIVSEWLAPYLQSPQIQYLVALTGIFIVSLLMLSMIAIIIVKLLTLVGIAGTDRSLGGLFGVVRGIAIALVLVFVIRLTPATGEAWFQSSMIVPYLEPIYEYLDDQNFLQPLDSLPERIAGSGQQRS